MLAEYLAGEAGGLDDQSQASRISRLVVAGNALGSMSGSAGALNGEPEKKPVGKFWHCDSHMYSWLFLY